MMTLSNIINKQKRMKIKFLGILLFMTCSTNYLRSQIPYPGESPGQAIIKQVNGNHIVLENNVISMEFINDGTKINILGFEDKKSHEKLRLGNTPIFEMILQDSSVITSNDFRLVNSPVISDFHGNPVAPIYADRLAGKKYSAEFKNLNTGLNLHWEADLRDGSNYIRQIFKFQTDDESSISKIILVKHPLNTGVRKEGKVDGSPIVHKNMFFALEHPLSKVELNKTYIIAYLPRLIPVVSTSWGVTPVNQLRRGFLYYIERERAHPYHQVLHYNSWYDISWDGRKFSESECLDRIKMFGDSLITKRRVPMKSFLFDDGWDDNKTLWQFHAGLSDGFTKLRKAAESFKSTVGVWFSPFGGYGTAKKERLEYGKKQVPPFETNDYGFAMAGKVYYNRFRDVTSSFVKKYNISMFKFDGLGAGNGAAVTYQKDVEAFLKLITELKGMKSDLYFSITTGTWASPYWLFYGDNIWRGGDDTNMMGEGSKRQQWITYRDAEVHKNVVKLGPLYPLNALMTCGICIADNGYPGGFEMNDKDISDEIWSFFGSGVNLQELYINPHKLNSANWNCLADASKWASQNEKIMADVHWTGGDPSKGEVYGFAAWSKGKGVLSLRNPSSIAKTFEVNVARAFELPDYESDEYLFYDAKTFSPTDKKQVFAQGNWFKITLEPYELILLNAFRKVF